MQYVYNLEFKNKKFVKLYTYVALDNDCSILQEGNKIVYIFLLANREPDSCRVRVVLKFSMDVRHPDIFGLKRNLII